MRQNVRPVLVLAVLASFATARASDPKLAKAGAPPEALPAAIRALVAEEGTQFSNEGKLVAEIWLCKALPTTGTPTSLGQSYGQIAEGTLVGVLRLPASWMDYKGQPVPPGTYTLRYAVQPADGNHTGTTIYRDFLALIPAASDTETQGPVAHTTLVDLSKKTTRTAHPAVLGLFPLFSVPPEPALTHNELDQWVLATVAGEVPLGLVLIGQADAP
jgi:hypothetical protein